MLTGCTKNEQSEVQPPPRRAADAALSQGGALSLEEVQERVVEIVREGSKPWEHDGQQGEGIDMAQIGTNWKRKHGDKLVPSNWGFERLGPMIAAMSDLLAVDKAGRTKRVVRLVDV